MPEARLQRTRDAYTFEWEKDIREYRAWRSWQDAKYRVPETCQGQRDQDRLLAAMRNIKGADA